jgi:DNA replication protein
MYILKSFKKMNLTMEEFIFLMYLYNKQDKIDFNPEKIASDMNIDIMEVMGYISILNDKGYLTLDVIKADNNIIEERINLTNFYEKISMLLIEKEEDKDTSILKYIETQLGRPLSSIDIEMINGWIKDDIDNSLIKEALRIALNDGVYSLKYIDRILMDFKFKGFKTIDDIKNNNLNNNQNDNLDLEIDDWNWLDDEEEYIIN